VWHGGLIAGFWGFGESDCRQDFIHVYIHLIILVYEDPARGETMKTFLKICLKIGGWLLVVVGITIIKILIGMPADERTWLYEHPEIITKSVSDWFNTAVLGHSKEWRELRETTTYATHADPGAYDLGFSDVSRLFKSDVWFYSDTFNALKHSAYDGLYQGPAASISIPEGMQYALLDHGKLSSYIAGATKAMAEKFPGIHITAATACISPRPDPCRIIFWADWSH
jgi:hypothetical protein